MLQMNVLQQAVQQYRERLEKELLGAWRAGYDYVHVYRVPQDPTEMPTFSRYLFPTDSQHPPTVSDRIYCHTYDLSDISRADIEVAHSE